MRAETCSNPPQEQGSWLRARIANEVGTIQLTVSGNHGHPYLSGSKRTWRSAVRNFHFQNQFDSLPAQFSTQRMPCNLAGIAGTRSRRAVAAREVTQPPSSEALALADGNWRPLARGPRQIRRQHLFHQLHFV